MTSLLSPLTSNRRILAKKPLSIWASCGIFIEKTDEISRKNWWDIENFALMHKILPE
jgi:hypothetical protein